MSLEKFKSALRALFHTVTGSHNCCEDLKNVLEKILCGLRTEETAYASDMKGKQ